MANRHRWTIVSLGVAAAVLSAAVEFGRRSAGPAEGKNGQRAAPVGAGGLSEKNRAPRRPRLRQGCQAAVKRSMRRAARQMRRSSFSSTAANGAKATRAKSATSPSFSTNRASSSSPPTTASRRR